MEAKTARKSVQESIAAIETLDLAPIKFRLAHPEAGNGWSREYTEQMEVEYKRFLTLVAKYPDEKIPPTKEVDEFWHRHILDTMKYAEDCERVFGYFLHHYPYFGLRSEQDAKDQETAGKTVARLYAQEFSSFPPAKAAQGALSDGASSAWCLATDKRPDRYDTAWCLATAEQSQLKETAWCLAAAGQHQGKRTADGRVERGAAQ